MEINPPTAEEHFLTIWGDLEKKDGEWVKVMPMHLEHYFTPNDVLELMRSFAKLHVTAALQNFANSVEASPSEINAQKEIENSILKSYPLTNIK